MTSVDEDREMHYAEKIRDLLAQAEGAGTEEEADTATAMAQRLMARYAISEELVNAARGLQRKEMVIKDHIDFVGIYRDTTCSLGHSVGLVNGCRAVLTRIAASGGRPATARLAIIGFESDVARVKLLTTSLELQMTTALSRWWKTVDTTYKSKMDKFKDKRTFITAFINAVFDKLQRAADAGRGEAERDEVKRSGSSASDVAKSTELVIRSKNEQVQDWMDRHYGNSLRSVSRRYQSGTYDARSAGHDAGRRADIGQPGVGTTRQLPGGAS